MKKLSEEHKEKIRQSKMGFKNPMYGRPATKGSFIKGYAIGDKNSNWRGGLPKCLDCSVLTKVRGARKAKRCQNCSYKARRITASKGEDHYMWKGGITPVRKGIERSEQYKEWRQGVFMRDDYTCQLCDERGGELNADHIKPFAYHPELRFDVSNGRTLCLACHRKTDTFGWRAWHSRRKEDQVANFVNVVS